MTNDCHSTAIWRWIRKSWMTWRPTNSSTNKVSNTNNSQFLTQNLMITTSNRQNKIIINNLKKTISSLSFKSSTISEMNNLIRLITIINNNYVFDLN